MKKGIIFDLDQTLVDSSISEIYRGKNWKKANELISNFTLYEGFEAVFDFIRQNRIKVAVVSTSISNYVNNVLNHFSIPYDVVIAYHDVYCKKPDPEAFINALKIMELSPKDVISFGDRGIDIQASYSANVDCVACLWGTKEKESLLRMKPTFVIESPIEIISIINL